MVKCNNPKCGHILNEPMRPKICPDCGYVMIPFEKRGIVMDSVPRGKIKKPEEKIDNGD